MSVYYIRVSMGAEGVAMLITVSFVAGVIADTIARWWRA